MTHSEIAQEIIEKLGSKIVDYGVAPSGSFFRSHTEHLNKKGIHSKCYLYIIFKSEKDGVEYTTRASHRNLLKVLSDLDKQGHLDVQKARKIVNENKCLKCNGSGYLEQYAHVHNGVCFKCGGTGTK